MARRRGNGEGTITRRKDGRWEARYTEHTAGPKRKVLYGKTRQEVAKKLTKAMADRDRGVTFDAENQTLGEFLARWIDISVRDNVRPRTLMVSVTAIRCRFDRLRWVQFSGALV